MASKEDIKVEVMFFKGRGNIVDKLIRWITSSSYSHVAIRVTTTVRKDAHIIEKNIIWYESMNGHGVRKGYNLHRGLEKDWDSLEINRAYKRGIEAIYERYKEYGYSYINLIFKLLGWKPFKKSLDCVEFANLCLNLITPETPQELYEILKYGGVGNNV